MEETTLTPITANETIKDVRYCKNCNNTLIAGYPASQWFCPWCKLVSNYRGMDDKERKHYQLFLKIRTANEEELNELSDEIATIDPKAKGKDYYIIIQSGKLRRLELETINILAISN